MTRHTLLALPVLGALALAALAVTLSVRSAPAAVPQASESPFYCDRSVLSSAERNRHFGVLGPALRDKRRAVRELADGYEFSFPTDAQTFGELAEWIEAERRCCPFFDIDLHVMPEGSAVWLRLSGRPGTKQFIQADGASWIKPLI